MSILNFFRKNDSANVAKKRLQVAVGKATIDIDNLISDMQDAINRSLAKYAIEGDQISFKHNQKKRQLTVVVPVES